MFVVHTEHPLEKARLQEQHPAINNHFWVDSEDAHTLVCLLRSILFEHFRGSPPLIAKKITQFIIDAVNMSISLTLFRQILSSIKSELSLLETYKDYFSEMEWKIGQDNESISYLQSETSYINELLDMEKTRCSKFVEGPEFQEALEQEIKNRNSLQNQSYLTKTTGHKDEKETILESVVTRTVLQTTLHRVNSNVAVDESLWWKRQNLQKCLSRDNNDSHSLIQYSRKRDNVLNNQDSIFTMMKKQAQFDDYMEQDRLTKSKKREQTKKKFNKRIKERLVSAKLGKKRKK